MKRYCMVIVMLCCILLTACNITETDSNHQLSPTPTVVSEQTITSTPQATITPEPTKSVDFSEQKKIELETTLNTVESQQDVKAILLEAIPLFCEKLSFDIEKAELNNQLPEHYVLNAYHNVLSEKSELKYAYEIQTKYDEDTQIVTCSIKYMPYKLGFEENELQKDARKVYTLKELISIAQDNLTETSVDIMIMNKELNVDDMQNALQQAGYGYILCSLNQDATQITMSPANYKTREESLSYIEETNLLADEILKDIVTDSMTDEEKIYAVYSYVAANTAYDHRYYSNRDEMPYESMTAYGALKDNLAICGGYSWAVRLLLDKLGIECYNVNGKSHGEYHMWNVIKYEGKYLYFDATYDRGITPELGYTRFAMSEEKAVMDREWNQSFFEHLLVSE